MIDISLAKFGIYIVNTMSAEQAADLTKFIGDHIHLFDDEAARGDGYNTKAKGITLGRLHAEGIAGAQEWDEFLFSSYVENVASINKALRFPVVVDSDVGYNLRRFESGADTGIHIDNLDYDGRGVRCLTAVTFLNSHEHTGGELVFPYQELQVKPDAGQTVMFPPYWTHPHYAKAVEKGQRHTVNTWFRQDL